jgi:hypothetical protein
MFFAEANWASGHEAASKGRTHDRIRAATESSYLALESRAVPHMTRVNLWFAGHTGVKVLAFSFRPLVAAVLALKRKLSLPVSTMWQW